MRTLQKAMQSPSAFDSLRNYLGDIPDAEWMCLLGQNRDSDCLTRSNFRSALKALGGEANENVRVFRFGHWACGWVEYLAVKGDRIPLAEEIEKAVEDYPVVDEEDFSNLEQEEANGTWENCFDNKQRLDYIRQHNHQFEFRDWHDLMGCVRGKWFAGYPSELLG